MVIKRMTNPGVFPGNRDFDSRRISLLSTDRNDRTLHLHCQLAACFSLIVPLLIGEEIRRMEHGSTFMIRLCSDRAAYEAVPKKRVKVDIASLRVLLERRGDCEITLCTPQLMVVRRSDATEVTIVDDGRMIIRNVADQDAARRIAEAILPNRTVEEC